MRNKSLLVVAILAGACLLLAGCGGNRLEGTWKVTGMKDMPPNANATATFGPGDSFKVTVETPNPIGQGKIIVDMTGTYVLKGDEMTPTMKDVAFKSEGLPDALKKVMESQFSGEAKKKALEGMNKDNTSKITWVDAKNFKSKTPKGEETTWTKQ